jgi:archaellum component FlaG (FlaF/FlaG flagellin family)
MNLEGNVMSLQKISMGSLMAIIAIATFLTVTSAGLLSVNQAIPSSGAVTAVNVGVYSNYACTQNLTSINWGTISPNSSSTRTIYVKNTGNTQLTLSMTKTNWNPAGANGPITVTWNKESTTLNPGQVATATLTLSVSESISGITDFNVDVVITGTG